ncbi:unnamed protein product [Calypogeia fissa]
MNLLSINRSRATVVVGVDFGTTFSGFAFALMSKPEDVQKVYDWPDLEPAGGHHYCKTQTSLLYEADPSSGSYLVKHLKEIRSQRTEQISYGDHVLGITNLLPQASAQETARRIEYYFLTLFKLHLVGGDSGSTSAAKLPEGLTIRRVISDYLRKLSEFIMTKVQSCMGAYLTMEDIQWCLTVPAIWDDRSKQEMKICASMAGMTKGAECPLESADMASPHPVIIVIEPEAASFYCQTKVPLALSTGDKFLIVDVGGGTVDLVLHEKIGSGSGLKVREVSPSSGGLFGGSFVDKAFFEFLRRKISCFEDFARADTDSILKLMGRWDTIKRSFDGNMHFPYDLELPARLATAWEKHESSSNRFSHIAGSYDAIELSLEDMRSLFDPVVDEIIKLIECKLIEDLRAMMVVGGFSGSPYLVKRINDEFSGRVGIIVIPEEPGAAICCGAVLFGLYGADLVCSRRSKKTYGIAISRRFYVTDPPCLMFQDDDGEEYCNNVFSAYTRINDEVPLEHRVSRKVYPICKSQTEASIGLFSTADSNPKYVCDPGVTKEGTFQVAFPSENELGEMPEILLSIYFGRTLIEVEAEGQNFRSVEKFKMSVTFEKTFE